jgi:hypothetical protein
VNPSVSVVPESAIDCDVRVWVPCDVLYTFSIPITGVPLVPAGTVMVNDEMFTPDAVVNP